MAHVALRAFRLAKLSFPAKTADPKRLQVILARATNHGGRRVAPPSPPKTCSGTINCGSCEGRNGQPQTAPPSCASTRVRCCSSKPAPRVEDDRYPMSDHLCQGVGLPGRVPSCPGEGQWEIQRWQRQMQGQGQREGQDEQRRQRRWQGEGQEHQEGWECPVERCVKHQGGQPYWNHSGRDVYHVCQVPRSAAAANKAANKDQELQNLREAAAEDQKKLMEKQKKDAQK